MTNSTKTKPRYTTEILVSPFISTRRNLFDDTGSIRKKSQLLGKVYDKIVPNVNLGLLSPVVFRHVV